MDIILLCYKLHSSPPPLHCSSVVHPSRDPTPPEPCREAQALRAHGEVADEIPHEGDELDDGGEEGEDGGLQLFITQETMSVYCTCPSLRMVIGWFVWWEVMVRGWRDTYTDGEIEREHDTAKVGRGEGDSFLGGEVIGCRGSAFT